MTLLLRYERNSNSMPTSGAVTKKKGQQMTKQKKLSLALICGLAFLASCVEESSAPWADYDAQPPDAIIVDAVPPRTNTALHIEGTLAGILAHDMGCSYTGGRMSVDLVVGDDPHVPARPDVVCSNNGEDPLVVHCHGLVQAAWIAYNDVFLFRLSFEQGNGLAVWWADGWGYFECALVFWIDSIEIQ
jgi:hypothetical protein